MKKFLSFIFLITAVSVFAGTRARWINGPENQGQLQLYDDVSGVSIITFTTNGIVITNLASAGSFTLPSSSVGSAEITDWSIATNDIGTNSVVSVNILDGTIATSDLGSASVTSNKIANNTIESFNINVGGVRSSNILDGTIVNADINASAAIAGSKLDMTNGTGVIISQSRALVLSANTADRTIDYGTATNGQVVTFTTPFTGVPRIAFGPESGATNVFASSINPTNFTMNATPVTATIDWVAAGSK